ncbi:MAG: M24 family metallopeptidase [Promethearchaeota archaeon]
MEDVYLDIPKLEISSRVERLQSRLLKSNLDGALLLSTIEMYYYSGIGIPGAVYVPAQGDPIRLVERNLELVRAHSALSDIRPMGRLSKIFETFGIAKASHIAFEGDIVPYSYVTFLQSKAEGIEFVDASQIFRETRSKKSDFEVGMIEEAAEQIDRSLTYCTEIATPEMTEIELSTRLDGWLIDHGHAGSITTRGFNSSMLIYSYVVSSGGSTLNTLFQPISGQGLSLKYPLGPTRRKLGQNRPFLVDSCGNYHGYISDTTRTLVCGRFDDRAHERLLALQEIKNFITKSMKPGCNLGSLYSEVIELSKELGINDNFMGPEEDKVAFIGHGVGLELDELPVFYAKGPSMEEGHVLASEPKLILPGEEVLGIEDTYAVTSTGCKILSKSDNWFQISR